MFMRPLGEDEVAIPGPVVQLGQITQGGPAPIYREAEPPPVRFVDDEGPSLELQAPGVEAPQGGMPSATKWIVGLAIAAGVWWGYRLWKEG